MLNFETDARVTDEPLPPDEALVVAIPTVAVGRGAHAQFMHLDVGDTIVSGQNRWQVVGVFEADGSVSETEVWCDARALQGAYRRGNSYQSVLAKLDSADSFTMFRDWLTSNPQLSVTIRRENEYYAGQSQALTTLIRTVGPSGALLCLRVREPDGSSIATGIVVGRNKRAVLWGAAFRREAAGSHPNEALHWEAMTYWRRRGAEWYHGVQDAAGMVRDFTKWDDTPWSLGHFAESAVRAYRVAMTPPMAPVVLVLDGHLQEGPLEGHGTLSVPRLSTTSSALDEVQVMSLSALTSADVLT